MPAQGLPTVPLRPVTPPMVVSNGAVAGHRERDKFDLHTTPTVGRPMALLMPSHRLARGGFNAKRPNAVQEASMVALWPAWGRPVADLALA